MKRMLSLVLLWLLALSAAWAAPVLEPLTILHTNDVHAHIAAADGRGGLAAICSYLKSVQAEEKNVLVLDAGDLITGTPVSTLFLGVPVFEIYNTMPYQVAVLGNHEFDHGWSQISEFLRVAEFPILSANIHLPSGALITGRATQGIAVGNLKIGIIGLTHPDLRRLTARAGWEGLTIEEPAAVAQRYVKALRPKADLLIALTHLGVDDDVALARAVPELDVIVGGHSHTELTQPRQVGNTLIVQAGSYSKYVGRLDLVVDLVEKRIVRHEGRLIPVAAESMGSDPVTAAAVEKWESRVREAVDVKIGDNASLKGRSELQDIISEVLRVTFETDFGYQNSGGVRADLSPGPILKRHIWTMLPFGNRVTLVTLERDQLSEFNVRAPAGEDKERYTVATNSYVAEQVAARLNLPPERIEMLPRLVRDVIIEYVEARGSLEMPALVPAVEGR